VRGQPSLTHLSCIWGLKVDAVHIDLRKALDRGRPSAALRAVSLQGASIQCVAALAALLHKGEAQLRVGFLVTEPIHMDRGGPQGAFGSPGLFIRVVVMVLMGFQLTWKARRSGWVCDQVQLAGVRVADDAILFSNSRDDLVRMLVETRDAFRSVGLDVGRGATGPAGHKKKRGRDP
jgi:hypothetical protein